MAKRGPKKSYDKWDIVKDNELLRKLIASRLKDKHLTYYEADDLAGIPRGYTNRYLNDVKHGMSQYAIIKLADVLGLEVNLRIEVKNPFSSDGNPSGVIFQPGHD